MQIALDRRFVVPVSQGLLGLPPTSLGVLRAISESSQTPVKPRHVSNAAKVPTVKLPDRLFAETAIQEAIPARMDRSNAPNASQEDLVTESR